MSPAGGIVEAGESWPLIGRREELDAIAACVGGRRGDSVVVVGAAGVGKTRLAAAAAAEARVAGMTVLPPMLGTRAAASIPFGAVADLLPGDNELAAGPQLLRAASRALRERGRGRRVILIVDDAHLLDPASAALVLHVSAADEVAVIAAVRSGEPCPDAVSALWKDRGALRLDLQPLSDREVRALLEASLPGAMVDGRVARAVASHSGGNPLYCRELVRAALATGQLQRVEGMWRHTGDAVIGQRLSELVAERVGALSEDERSAMELVLLAEPIPLELLEALVGDRTPAELERRQLLAVDDSAPPRARLGHPIYGDVIGRQLGGVRRRQHSRVLAQALEARADLSNRELVRLATWRLDAGEADTPLLTRAAASANAMFDHDLAVRLASAALEHGAGTGAALVLAAAETAGNRFAAAEAALAPWEGQIGSQVDGKAYIAMRVPLLCWGLDDPEAADVVLHRARTWLPGRPWRQYLQAWSIELDQDRGRITKAARDGRALLDEGDLEPETQLLATFATCVALLFTGSTRRAQAVADASFALASARALELREYAWGALAAWLAVRLETGRDHGRLESLVDRVHAYAARQDDDELLGLAELTLGRIALAHGAVDAAHRWLTEAAAHLEDCDPRYIRGVCLAMLARLEAYRGRAEAAEAAQARADATYPAMQRKHWMYRHEYARARAWVAAADGDLTLAQRIALDAADECDEYVLTEITFLHDALRLGSPPETLAARISALAVRTDSALAHTQTQHASAAARHDAAAVAAAAERFARIGANLLAAEAQSSATRLYSRGGDSADARRAIARARELVANCPGASTPLLGEIRHQALTRREHHVVRLAANGLTNNQIAEQLVVSIRTVESHLHHAFEKLGVKNRSQLEDREHTTSANTPDST